ncbi:hypothetical protein ACEQ8H_007343 [Pleosporales sp. CAS-2024a]
MSDLDITTFRFNPYIFINIVHELEEIPAHAQPLHNDSIIRGITRTDISRWQKAFGFTVSEARFMIYRVRATRGETYDKKSGKTAREWPWEVCRALGFSREMHKFWLESAEKNGAVKPADMGTISARRRGEFEIFLLQDVDDHIDRLGCVPTLGRQGGFRKHPVIDSKGNFRQAIVLRGWEANLLKGIIPMCMMDEDGCWHLARNWECMWTSWAKKDLDDTSRHACIIGSTLGQSRLDESEIARPRQHEFPVWYFLDGIISHPAKLMALWKLEQEPYGREAKVYGLRRSRYRFTTGLTQASAQGEARDEDGVKGLAYLVMNKLAEDRLRFFKTNVFEVRRCDIELQPVTPYSQAHTVRGLAFLYRYPELSTPIVSSRTKIQNKLKGEETLAASDHGKKADGRIQSAECREERWPERYRLGFPFLREDVEYRCRDAAQTNARRDLMLSSERPRSSLDQVTSMSEIPSPTNSTTDEANDEAEPEASDCGRRDCYQEAGCWWKQAVGTMSKTATNDSIGHSCQRGTAVHIEDVSLIADWNETLEKAGTLSPRPSDKDEQGDESGRDVKD